MPVLGICRINTFYWLQKYLHPFIHPSSYHKMDKLENLICQVIYWLANPPRFVFPPLIVNGHKTANQLRFAHCRQQLKGLKEENEETFEETEKVPAFPYYPVDSSVLNNIVGSVQAMKVPNIQKDPITDSTSIMTILIPSGSDHKSFGSERRGRGHCSECNRGEGCASAIPYY